MARPNDKTTEMTLGLVGPSVTSVESVKNEHEAESLVGVVPAQSCHLTDQYPVKRANRRGYMGSRASEAAVCWAYLAGWEGSDQIASVTAVAITMGIEPISCSPRLRRGGCKSITTPTCFVAYGSSACATGGYPNGCHVNSGCFPPLSLSECGNTTAETERSALCFDDGIGYNDMGG
jgi:hypothetical protein